MTKVVFETATFADAIRKADRVAPSKGMAFDKAAGIVIEVDPNSDPAVTIRATNLDVFYREWVDAVKAEGEPTVWRIPASLIATMVGSLPIGSGREVTLEEVTKNNHTHLQVTSGKTKARFNLITTEFYPDWDVFDPDDLGTVSDLGGRISMVEWAADKTQVPLNGICFTEGTIITTDRYRLAKTALALPNQKDAQVIVPAGILGSVLKQTGEVRIGFTEHQVLLMPNETTQLRVVRFDAEYPNVARIMDSERPNHVEVPKGVLLDVIRRTTAFSGAERMPTIRMFLGKEELAIIVDNADVGAIQDVLDVPGQCDHERVEIRFTPKNLVEALDKAPNERVKLGYDKDAPGKIMHIDGGSGYECWVVTRRENEA